MKFEDLKVGMRVRDHLGNEYEVVYVEEKRDSFPVQLQCTKLVQAVQVDTNTEFNAVGDTWWVGCNSQYILNVSDEAIQQILRGLGVAYEYISTTTIQMRIPSGDTQDFYVYPESRIVEMMLTCDELNPISQVEPVVAAETAEAVVSTDSLKLGMKLVDSAGEGFILVGYDDKWVHMASMLPIHPIGSCDTCVPALIRIPLEDTALAGFVPAED